MRSQSAVSASIARFTKPVLPSLKVARYRSTGVYPPVTGCLATTLFIGRSSRSGILIGMGTRRFLMVCVFAAACVGPSQFGTTDSGVFRPTITDTPTPTDTDSDDPAPANAPPTLDAGEFDDAIENIEIVIALTAVDPEGAGPVAIRLDEGPEGATIAGGALVWTPPIGTAPCRGKVSVDFALSAIDPADSNLTTSLLLNLDVYAYTDGDSDGDLDDDDLDGDGLDNLDELNTDRCNDDSDGDGSEDGDDNCPTQVNADQSDIDGDNVGDLCDVCPGDADDDADGDGFCGDLDNCPSDGNPYQEDLDLDGIGDVCDICPGDAGDDAEGDGTCNDIDNCPLLYNPFQEDIDLDGLGDLCDTCPQDPLNDPDNDLICSEVDTCYDVYDPGQEDLDLDGIGDLCDDCLVDPNNDFDRDGLCAEVDNCPLDFNDTQTDTDLDSAGDACDVDDDNDGVDDLFPDNCQQVPNPDQADLDGDGDGDLCDDDIDGDGLFNGIDPCPRVAVPVLYDVDLDGVGLPCDDWVDLDPGIVSIATPSIAGAAVGDTFALTLSDPAGLASLLAIESGGLAYTEVPNYFDASAGGMLLAPEVSGDGVSWFGFQDGGGLIDVGLILGGTPASQWSGLDDYFRLDHPAGGSLLGVESGGWSLYSQLGASLPLVLATPDLPTDSEGGGYQGPAADGWVYMPLQTGSSFTLRGYGPMGTVDIITSDYLASITLDPEPDQPLYCWHDGGVPTLSRVVDGVPQSTAVSNMSSCADLSTPEADDDSDALWIRYLNSGGQSNEIAWFEPGMPLNVVFAGGALGGTVTVHNAGPETWFESSCGLGCVDVWRLTGPITTNVVDTVTDLYFRKIAVHPDGHVVLAGRDALTGAADLIAWIGQPGGGSFSANLTNQPTTGPVANDVSLTEGGVAWIDGEINPGITERWLFSLHDDAGLPQATRQLQLATMANAVDLGIAGLEGQALVSVDGIDGGIYGAEVVGPVIDLTLLAVSDGLAYDLLETPGGLWQGNRWIGYPTLGGTWEFASVSNDAGAPALQLELSGAAPWPSSAVASDGDPWLLYTAGGLVHIATLGGGAIEDRGQADVSAALIDDADGTFWGVDLESASGHTTCRIDPEETCWTTPAGNYTLVWGPLASEQSAYAVYRDLDDDSHHLWRNVDE